MKPKYFFLFFFSTSIFLINHTYAGSSYIYNKSDVKFKVFDEDYDYQGPLYPENKIEVDSNSFPMHLRDKHDVDAELKVEMQH